MPNYTETVYCGFTIKPKLDFGGKPFIINGRWVSEGFVVTKDGCNAMPGATWFETVDEAMDGIAAYIAADRNADKFWALMRLTRRTS